MTAATPAAVVSPRLRCGWNAPLGMFIGSVIDGEAEEEDASAAG